MPPFSSLLRPVKRSLNQHVGQLQTNLDTLNERLRESIAHTVAMAVARAVREAVNSLLAKRESYTMQPPPSRHRYEESSNHWDHPDFDDEPQWFKDTEESFFDEGTRGESSLESKPAHQRRGYVALVAGCQAATWWLRRSTGKRSILSALGIGLLACGATYLFGPWALAGAAVFGSTLGMLQLVDKTISWVGLAHLESS